MLTNQSVLATEQDSLALVLSHEPKDMLAIPGQVLVSSRANGSAGSIYESIYSDDALAAFGAFLAREMKFDLVQAQGHPLWWYAEQVGEDICPLSRAAMLRRLTAQACMDRMTVLLQERAEARREFDASRFEMLPGRMDLGIVPQRAEVYRAIWCAVIVAGAVAAIWCAGGVFVARFRL